MLRWYRLYPDKLDILQSYFKNTLSDSSQRLVRYIDERKNGDEMKSSHHSSNDDFISRSASMQYETIMHEYAVLTIR